MTKVEIARAFQRIRKVQNDMDALKRELDELKDTVKAKMVATGEHKVEAAAVSQPIRKSLVTVLIALP